MCLVSEWILQYNTDCHLIYIQNTHHRQAKADTHIIKQTTRTSTRTAHVTILCFYHPVMYYSPITVAMSR